MMSESSSESSGAPTFFYQLYPFLDELNIQIPICWNPKDKHKFISLSNSNLAVHYKGPGKKPQDAASVRANQPVPSACGIYYFEVKITSKGRDGYMGIGLSSSDVNTNRLPGWDKKSYGYHGDDGNSFCCSGQGLHYGPTFTTGDVIGCCLNMIDNTCFFTKNGVNLGVAFKDLPPDLYPTVGLQTPGEVVEANFGQRPFVFDIEDYVKEYKLAIQEKINSVSSEGNKDNWQSTLHSVISSYLVHYGYCSTAESFARDTGQILQEEPVSIKNRQRIQKLILSGKLGEAIHSTQELYPGLLENNLNLKFMLKCRQFVEMINGTDSEVSTLRSSVHSTPHTLSNKSSPCMSPHRTSVHSSRSSSPYRHTINSPQSTHSNGTTPTPHQLDNNSTTNTSNNCSSNGYNRISNGSSDNAYNDSERNGDSNSQTQQNSDGMEVDEPAKSIINPSKSGNETVLIKILQFGKELKAMHRKLTETSGSNPANDQLLQRVFSLLAYADPWTSPVGSQLDPVEREPVCAALNSAILEYHGLPQLSVLETTVGQAHLTLHEMSKAGIGASALAHLSDYITLCKATNPPAASQSQTGTPR